MIRLSSILLFLLSGSALAGCPEGTYQESTRDVVYCVPLPNAGAANGPAGPQWLTQWGAIAYGGGGFGAARGESSKRRAEKIAIKQCRDTGGGKKCQVALSYSNQCAAYAIGKNYAVGWAGGPNLSEVKRRALSICAETDQECQVTYSACSYPAQLVR